MHTVSNPSPALIEEVWCGGLQSVTEVSPSQGPCLGPEAYDSRSWPGPPLSTSGDSGVPVKEKLPKSSCSRSTLKRLHISWEGLVNFAQNSYANRAAKPEFK